MAYGDFRDLNRRTSADKVLKHLILLKIQNLMDMSVDLLQWSKNFLIKISLVVVLKMKIFLIKNQHKNLTNQLLENLINQK